MFRNENNIDISLYQIYIYIYIEREREREKERDSAGRNVISYHIKECVINSIISVASDISLTFHITQAQFSKEDNYQTLIIV